MCVTPEEATWKVISEGSLSEKMAEVILRYGRQNLRFEMQRDDSTNSTYLMASMKIQVTDEYIAMMDWAGGGSGLVG